MSVAEVEVDMGSLGLVDRLEVVVLVDNSSDTLSSMPPGVTARPELQLLLAAGMKELKGDSQCCALHGLSLLITAHRDNQPPVTWVVQSGGVRSVSGRLGGLQLSRGSR